MEKIVNNLTSCSHPSRIVNKATGEFMFVPCGHCSSCRDSYTKNWISRLEAETRDSNSTLFFTLTYDNDHIPTVLHDGNIFISQCGNRVNDFIIPQLDYKQFFENGTNWTELYVRESRQSTSKKAFEISINSKRDMQLFLKRLRRYVSRDKHHLLDDISQSDRQIRYFLTTEYGPNSFRTHAHGLLWFKNRKVAQSVVDYYFYESWKLGAPERQDVGFVIKDAPWYVAKYVSCNTSLPPILQTEFTKTFHLFSRRPSIGITSDSLDIMSRVFKESNLNYTKTITSNTDGIYDLQLRYERRFLQYWFPNLLRSSRLSCDFMRRFINDALSFFDRKGLKYLDFDVIGCILPNLIQSVKRRYNLDKFFIPCSLDPSCKAPVYSDIVEQLSDFEYMYGLPQSRLFIKRAIMYMINTDCTVDEYIDMWNRIRTLMFTNAFKAQVDYSNYLYYSSRTPIQKFLLIYPDFPLNLPRNREMLTLHSEIFYETVLSDFNLCVDDFYNDRGFLLFDTDYCSTHHVQFSEFLVHENKIKESNMKFEKKRKLNYKLYFND